MLRRLVLPARTHRLNKLSVASLSRPAMIIGSAQIVHITAFFSTPEMSPGELLDFIQKHPPTATGLIRRESNHTPGGRNWDAAFSPSKTSSSIENAVLDVPAAFAPGGGTQERVDAEVVWQYPHPRDEIVPIGIPGAVVTYSVRSQRQWRAVHSARFFQGRALARIVRAFNQLPAATPGLVFSCTPFQGRLKVAFPRTSTSASIVAIIPSCGNVTVTIGGSPAPSLNSMGRPVWGGSVLTDELFAPLRIIPNGVF